MKKFLLFSFIFALLSIDSHAAIKADMSGCVPIPKNVQGSAFEYAIDSNGNLVFDNKSPLIKSSKKNTTTDYIKRKIIGQSAHAQITLTRSSNGYPSKIEIVEPQYDSDTPSSTATLHFAYQDGKDGKKHCFIQDYQVKEHEGHNKGKTLAFYNNDLCSALDETLDAKTADIINRCAPVLEKLDQVVNKHRQEYKKQKIELYQFVGRNDSNTTLTEIIETLVDCKRVRRDMFPNFKYPTPSRERGITIPGLHIPPIKLFKNGGPLKVLDGR